MIGIKSYEIVNYFHFIASQPIFDKYWVANDTWTCLGDEFQVAKFHILGLKPLQNDVSRAFPN